MWQVHVASYKLLTFLYDKPSRVLSMPKRDPLILVTFSVCVCEHAWAHVHKTTYRNWFSPFTMQVPGRKVGPKLDVGLVANTSIC